MEQALIGDASGNTAADQVKRKSDAVSLNLKAGAFIHLLTVGMR